MTVRLPSSTFTPLLLAMMSSGMGGANRLSLLMSNALDWTVSEEEGEGEGDWVREREREREEREGWVALH